MNNRFRAVLSRVLRCQEPSADAARPQSVPSEIREASHRLANHATEVQALTRLMTQETDVLTALTRAMRASGKNDS